MLRSGRSVWKVLALLLAVAPAATAQEGTAQAPAAPAPDDGAATRPVIFVRHLDPAPPAAPADAAQENGAAERNALEDLVAASEARVGTSPGPRPGASSAADGPFPARAALSVEVGFWQQVFASWGMDQAALHDNRYLGLVYDVIPLPGGLVPDWTDDQRLVARAHREQLESRLRVLESKLRGGLPLEPDEERLRDRIAAAAGAGAIAGASERVRVQRGMRERFRRGLEISGRYDALFREIFRAHGVPEDLAFLPHVESSFQAAARSSAGALGVWQFTRPAARLYMKLDRAVDERLDPVAAAEGAAKYLRDAHAKLGDWGLAITSYNHGVGGMLAAAEAHGADIERIVRQYNGKLFGFASRNFYAEFLAVREIASNPARFFPEGIRYEAPLAHERVTLARATSIAALAKRFGTSVRAFAEVNPAFSRHAIAGKVAIPAGVKVWVPSTAIARRNAPAALTATSGAAAATSGAAIERTDDHVIHTVRRGETLERIAAKYGVKLADLLGLNGVTRTSALKPGVRLRVPLAAAR